MNRKTIYFLIGLFFSNLLLTVCLTVLIDSAIGITKGSLLAWLLIIVGIIGLFSSIAIMIFLYKIKIPPYSKDRQYKEERKVMATFALITYIVVLSLGTVLIYMSLNFLNYMFPEIYEILGEYMYLMYPAAIGALWGIGITEAMHVGNLAKYGKKHQENIYWSREIQGGKDWYPDIKSFEENLHYWMKHLIPYSAIFSIIVFILFPRFYELIN